MDKDVPKTQDILYRFEGENKYLEYFTPNTGDRDQSSYVKGKFTLLYTKNKAPAATITSKHFVQTMNGQWDPPWPDEMIFAPTSVFQQPIMSMGMTLNAYCETGHTLMYSRNGRDILIHRRPGMGRLEIELDEANRVKQIVYAGDWRDEDVTAHYAGEPLDVYYPIFGYAYDKYERINDVWFPLRCVKTHYTGGEPEHEIMMRRNRGEIAGVAAEVLIATTAVFFPCNVASVDFDRATLVVNEPIGEDAFKIDVPRDALPLDSDGVVITPPGRWDWLRRHETLIVSITAACLVSVGLLIYTARKYWLLA